jgi:hypothetical protein
VSADAYCPRCFRDHMPLTRQRRFATHMTGCTNRHRPCRNHMKCPHKRPCPGIGQPAPAREEEATR